MSNNTEPGRGKKLVQELFSPERIALQREVNQHPKLVVLLKPYAKDDWGGILGEIAAYCLVAMDGIYMPSELDFLAGELYWKLKDKRMIVMH